MYIQEVVTASLLNDLNYKVNKVLEKYKDNPYATVNSTTIFFINGVINEFILIEDGSDGNSSSEPF